MSRLLVCPPDHFGISYEINPWMRLSNQADVVRAQAQWHGLMRQLEAIGVQLERLPPVAGLPDLVFTANAGSIRGSKAVPSHFRPPERRPEERHFEHWFRRQGYEVVLLDEGLYFEGDGDLLGFPDVQFGGYRQRSDIRAYAQLSEIFGVEIIPLELVSPSFYHLDTCFCPLSGGEALYYPPAFDPYAQTVIQERLDKDRRLSVPERDAQRFACNAVCVGRDVVLPDGCDETMKLLEARGYRTHPTPLDEFMKAGGSAKCLTLSLP